MDKIEFSTGGFPLSTDRLADMQQCWQFIAELAKAWGNNAVIHGCSGWASGGAVSDGLIVFNGEMLPFRSGGQGHRVQVIEQKHPITYSDGSQRTFRTTRYATATTSSASGTLPQSSFAQASQIPQLATAALLNQKVAALNQKDTDILRQIGDIYSEISTAISQLSSGQVNLNTNVQSNAQWLVPAGAIIMWSGAINQIPTGWALCDGKQGTPDLRQKFVVGAGGQGGYAVGDIGGEDKVKLTITHMPPHAHTVSVPTPAFNRNITKLGADTQAGRSNGAINYTTTTVGYGMPHENRPPYYALAYIMKLPE